MPRRPQGGPDSPQEENNITPIAPETNETQPGEHSRPPRRAPRAHRRAESSETREPSGISRSTADAQIPPAPAGDPQPRRPRRQRDTSSFPDSIEPPVQSFPETPEQLSRMVRTGPRREGAGEQQPGNDRDHRRGNLPRAAEQRENRPPRDHGDASTSEGAPPTDAPQPEGGQQSRSAGAQPQSGSSRPGGRARGNRRRGRQQPTNRPAVQETAGEQRQPAADNPTEANGKRQEGDRRRGQRFGRSRRGVQQPRDSRAQQAPRSDGPPESGSMPSGRSKDLRPDGDRRPRQENRPRQPGTRPQGQQGNRPRDRRPGDHRRPEYTFSYQAPPSLPIPTDRGIKARSHQGSFSKNWWARRWIEAMERLVLAARLQRGRSYARAGQVLSVQEVNNGITAMVQGSRPAPYRVEIRLAPLTDEQWEQVIDAMAEQALFTAQLLAGEMPSNIEDAFESAGVSLFPTRAGDLTTDCTCPDWANPCKHVAATHYILGDRFDDDPFLLFRLRGRSQEQILEGLRQRRAGHTGTSEEEAAAESVLSLEEQMNRFWEPGEPLDSFALGIRPPNIEMPLLQRLGEPAFLAGESLQNLLRPMYGIFLRNALRAAYSEDEPAETSADDEVINGG